MKKIHKKICTLICSFVGVILVLCGCGGGSKETSKTFEKAGLAITLTTEFHEKEHVEYTAYYASDKMIVVTIKESFTSFEKVGKDAEMMSVEEYARLVLDTYQDFYNSASEVTVENDMVSFVYENDALGKDYKYVWYGFKAVDAFWAVQFGCVDANFDSLQSEMLAYAKTVEIEKYKGTLAFQKIVDKEEYRVVGLGSVTDSHIVIPSEYKGLPVTEIARRAFTENTQIKSIEIPDTISTMEQGVFEKCVALESVSLPKTITDIPMRTFYDCDSLRTITIPDSVKQIGSSAFYNCDSLRMITIPDSVKQIGSSAFYGCNSLNHVTLGKNVKTIDMHAFFGCYTLVEILNKSEISLQVDGGPDPFDNHYLDDYARNIYGVDGQSKLSVDDNGYVVFTDNDKKVLVGYQGENKSLVVPNGITELQTGVFFAKDFTSIVLPDSLEMIGSSAFSHCYDLIDVNIPNGVCVIPFDAFYYCKSLKEIVLPSTVESIDYEAFYGCIALTEIVIPNSVVSIGSSCFFECDSLESVTIPNSVTNMGEEVFSGCDNLRTVIWSIPDNKTVSFGRGIFQNCPNLQYNSYDNAYYLGDAEDPYQILVKAKTLDIRTCKIFEGAKIIYCAAFGNCSRLSEVEIPNGIFAIGDSAFYKCSTLVRITLGNSLTEIGRSAFYACEKLIEVYNKSALQIEQGQQTFGEVAKYARNVYSQEDGRKISKENGYYIYDDTDKKILVLYVGSETHVIIPEGIRELGEGAFMGNREMESVKIPESVTVIGVGAFMQCENLQSVDIPDSVIEIGAIAFYSCSSLKTVRLPNGIEEIADETFACCENLTSIIIPDSVVKIGGYAFESCKALSWIVWGKGISSAGSFPFIECSSLQAVYYKGENTYRGFSSSIRAYYYSELEPALNQEGTAYNGNYWRYENGVPTVWVYTKQVV